MILNFRKAAVLAMLVAYAGQAWSQTVYYFTPTMGAPGDQVTVVGQGFTGSLQLWFNGTLDRTANAPTDNTINATVPGGATTGPLWIRVNGGNIYYTSDFTVIGPGPLVTNFSPYIGSAGTTVYIGGVHFTGATSASFNGVAGTGLYVQSDNVIQVHAPPGVTSGPISVTTPQGSTTSSNFYVPPTLTSFSPSSGQTGTNVTINGSNLLGATAVRFNGLYATSFTATNDVAIQATVPVYATTGTIRIDTPAGSAISSSSFVVQPSIYGFTPNTGPVGTSVTVTGANFNVSGLTVTFYNGVGASVAAGATFSQLMATVPAGATTGPITVSTADGSSTSASYFFVPPSITSFTPNNSGPGTTVKITGQNFLGASSVSFNGVYASFTVSNNTTIGATVPSGITNGPITVTAPAGSVASSGLFYAPLTISSFNPTHGLPGTNMTITGLNFLGATSVKFNGSNAMFSVSDNSTIHATVPAGATTGPITVIGPAGTNTTAANFVLDYTADVSVYITGTPTSLLVGSNLVYQITVFNGGPATAQNVRLTNTLPAGVALKSAALSQGTMVTNGNPITASLGTVNSSGAAYLTLTVVALATGTLVDTVSVGNDVQDPVPANNAASVTNTVTSIPILSITPLAGRRVQVSWPVYLSNFVLEYRASFLGTSSWSNVTTAPVVIGGANTVTESNSAPSRYYRLRD